MLTAAFGRGRNDRVSASVCSSSSLWSSPSSLREWTCVGLFSQTLGLNQKGTNHEAQNWEAQISCFVGPSQLKIKIDQGIKEKKLPS